VLAQTSYVFGHGGIQMNRDTIVEHVKTRDQVIVWTASDFDRYWVYRPGKDRVDSVHIQGPVQAAIKDIAEGEGVNGGIWVRGLAGIAALFPLVFQGASSYLCRHCDDFHYSDDIAEWMLLGKLDRALSQSEFNALPFRLTHPKRQNESSDDPRVVMTAEEEKRAAEALQRHFAEDREEFHSW
jgi:hypothetical protein